MPSSEATPPSLHPERCVMTVLLPQVRQSRLMSQTMRLRLQEASSISKKTGKDHMRKHRSGFSYAEIIIAFAVFSIIVGTVFFMAAQTNNNLRFAQEFHAAHLDAHRLMLYARAALASPPALAIQDIGTHTGVSSYSIWVIENDNIKIFGNEPPKPLHINGGFNMRLIVAVIWNDNGVPVGRAVGAAP